MLVYMLELGYVESERRYSTNPSPYHFLPYGRGIAMPPCYPRYEFSGEFETYFESYLKRESIETHPHPFSGLFFSGALLAYTPYKRPDKIFNTYFTTSIFFHIEPIKKEPRRAPHLLLPSSPYISEP